MRLNLYDKDLNRIMIIGIHYISCLWSEGYNTIEKFCLELNDVEEYRQKVRPDCYVGRDDRKTLMIIKTVEFSNQKIIANGEQAARVLNDVSFIGTIPAGSYIDTAIIDAYNKSTKYPNLEIINSELGVKYNQQISNKLFDELLFNMCQSEDVGFRVVKANQKMGLEFYQPAENPNLVFSEKFGNLKLEKMILSNSNLKNYAIVLGQGEDENRVRVDVDNTQGLQRLDIIIDARDIQMEEGESEESYRNRLAIRGAEELRTRKKTFECAFIPLAEEFMKRYDLGDILIVRLVGYDIALKSRVTKFTQKSQKNKIETTISVGEITISR